MCTYRQKLGKELHITLTYTGTDYLCCVACAHQIPAQCNRNEWHPHI